MAISSQTARVQYTLTGSGQTLAVPFYFLDADDITVVSTNPLTGVDTTLVRTTDYSVAGAGSESGGSVTLVGGTVGHLLTIFRDGEAVQPVPYGYNSQFPASTVEKGFDRMTMLLQQALLLLKRVVRLPMSGSEQPDLTLATRAGKVLAFDDAGNVQMTLSVEALQRIITANPSGLFTAVSLTDWGTLGSGVAIQRRRGSTIQHAAFTGQNGEITVDTTRKVPVVHDGLSAGGFPVDYVVNVRRFGAQGDGVTDDSAAILAAIQAVEAAGGGTVFFPKGNYLVTDGVVKHTVSDISLVLRGEGPTSTNISAVGNGVKVEVSTNASNNSHFGMHGIGINGPGGAAPDGVGLQMTGTVNNWSITDCMFNGLDRCIRLQNCFHGVVIGCRFRNYVRGICGTGGYSANNNTFENCWFGDGMNVAPAVALPVDSVGMGYNTYINCNFESRGLIKTVDMRNGSGYDTMIGCRFEQFNAGTADWLIAGNNQHYISCTWWPSAAYNVMGTAFALIRCGESTHGKSNRFDGVTVDSAYSSNLMILDEGSVNNYVRLIPPPATDSYSAVWNLVDDIGQDNLIEYPGKSFQHGRVNTWGGGHMNQWLKDSVGFSLLTFDGLVNAGNPGGAGENAIGPHGDGYSTQINTPTGNRRFYFTLGASNGYLYTFSIWVLAKVPLESIDIFAGSSLAAPTYRPVTVRSSTKWQRIWITYKATANANIYVGLRMGVGSTGIYIAGPQLEEQNASNIRLGPGAYVQTTANTGTWVQEINPRALSDRDRFGIGAPTVGRHTRGDTVWNIDSAVGQPIGWRCTASGTPGTWVAMANL